MQGACFTMLIFGLTLFLQQLAQYHKREKYDYNKYRDKSRHKFYLRKLMRQLSKHYSVLTIF